MLVGTRVVHAVIMCTRVHYLVTVSSVHVLRMVPQYGKKQAIAVVLLADDSIIVEQL